MVQRSGRASQALTRLVLEAKGRACQVGLPGCTKAATTRDHIIPVAQGGTASLDNLRPACRPCNSKRGNRNRGQRIHIVMGPPAGGKSSYIREHAGPLDVVIDLDKIAGAIMAGDPDGHAYPDHIRHIAIGMRETAIARATRLRERVHVWVIHSVPTPDRVGEYRAHGWDLITCDPGRAEVLRRAAADARPSGAYGAIDRWYEQQSVPQAGEHSTELISAPSRAW